MSKKLELLKPFNLNLESYSGYNSIYNFTGYINKINDFLTELKNITARYHLEKYVANKNKPILLSTGLSNMEEIKNTSQNAL